MNTKNFSFHFFFFQFNPKNVQPKKKKTLKIILQKTLVEMDLDEYSLLSTTISPFVAAQQASKTVQT